MVVGSWVYVAWGARRVAASGRTNELRLQPTTTYAAAMMTIETSSGAKAQVYFNIDRVMRWSAERFKPQK